MTAMSVIADAEVRQLARFSEALQKVLPPPGKDAWKGSPFAWIRNRPSRQIGTIFEKLVAEYLTDKGFDVAGSPDGEADRIVNDVRVEIKSSTLWAGGFTSSSSCGIRITAWFCVSE